MRLEPIDREPLERRIRAVREALGGTRFEEFWDRGRSLTLDEALAAVERPRQKGRPAGAAAAAGLTQRELQVLRLVADGLSNQQIAASLYVSEHTVHRHLANIRRKLKLFARRARRPRRATRPALSRSLGWPERAILSDVLGNDPRGRSDVTLIAKPSGIAEMECIPQTLTAPPLGDDLEGERREPCH